MYNIYIKIVCNKGFGFPMGTKGDSTHASPGADHCYYN